LSDQKRAFYAQDAGCPEPVALSVPFAFRFQRRGAFVTERTLAYMAVKPLETDCLPPPDLRLLALFYASVKQETYTLPFFTDFQDVDTWRIRKRGNPPTLPRMKAARKQATYWHWKAITP
jgi:hypothetical protein